MSHPLASVEDLEEMVKDEDARIARLVLVRPPSWAAAHKRTEALTEAKARKAGLLGELAARETAA